MKIETSFPGLDEEKIKPRVLICEDDKDNTLCTFFRGNLGNRQILNYAITMLRTYLSMVPANELEQTEALLSDMIQAEFITNTYGSKFEKLD